MLITITITCTSSITIITSKQTISNHMQAARCLLLLLLLVLVLSLLLLVSRRYQTTCKRRGAYYRRTPIPRSKAWLLLMHDSRAYQCEVSTRYMYLWRAYAAYAWWHVWRRTRQATTCVTNACFQPHVNQLHWWSPRWISASCGNLFFSRTWIILWSWRCIVHTHTHDIEQ